MKSLFFLLCAIFLMAVSSQAQTKGNDVLKKSGAAAGGALNTIDSTASQLKGFADKWAPKKKPLNTTVIKVPGATYGKIKQILESVKTCPGVDKSTAKMTCDDKDQSITVMHKGSTDDLLSALMQKTTLVKDTNVQLSEGLITVKLEQ